MTAMLTGHIPTTTAPEQTLHLQVAARESLTPEVVLLTLERADGVPLPHWSPGAHVDLMLDIGPRQYSLCGDPTDPTRWQVAVLREPDGRGGSAYVHEQVHEGTEITVQGPRNHFALVEAPHYTFIAGGIGITPLLPMIAQATRTGTPWRLFYGGRCLESMAFHDQLTSRYDEQVVLHPQDEHGVLDLPGIVESVPADGVVYCCGPEGLLGALERTCSDRSMPTPHVERFAPKDLGDTEDVEFEVELAETGDIVNVPAGCSVLEALRQHGVDVPSSCQEGTCGTCETGVLAGTVEHRDSLLTPQEQEAMDTMFICVSRSRGERLRLEL
ncbi:PDR/VanB family oxidoreductase [Flexivirga meconopsidis]|uniref:PDR/VanB family oxidoreductase n=1 Tax=Flexivirga meconopsidis TaxID=2977121 RepID=UPI00223EE236|nr:PDR/VanB family oxidoreductase [Flexivirga meconopsidis]